MTERKRAARVPEARSSAAGRGVLTRALKEPRGVYGPARLHRGVPSFVRPLLLVGGQNAPEARAPGCWSPGPAGHLGKVTLGLLGGAEEGKGQGCRVGGGGLRVPVHLGLPAEPRPEAGLLSGDAGAPATHDHPACLSGLWSSQSPTPDMGAGQRALAYGLNSLGK